MPKKKDDTKKHEEIATEFNCDQSIVSKILKQKKWSEVQETSQISNALKIASPKFSQVEKALEIWISSAKQQNLIISARIGLYNHQIHGEAESAPIEFLLQFREELKVLLATYEHKIFLMLMNVAYTIVWILDGTKKLMPLVINTSKMPNAFCNANITYNQLIFQIQERKILLLIDGAFSHKVDFNEYPNIHVHILSPHTTSYLQPMDVKVINAFKAHYKCLYIYKVICDFDIEMMIEDKTQNIQISEFIVAQHKAQDIIDLTINTDI
ncbi:46300_t:CDS:2 [Gigaspora margarita]|uniref:46300_t:CDS:1 n=1 Tax=Gigaspora margarita TaxID=4874 RepID=A0ABN7WXH7_GIGMA|nr:46300_t:CDS:2 [Gigaspora margarita]